jgi:hypothetical protein
MSFILGIHYISQALSTIMGCFSFSLTFIHPPESFRKIIIQRPPERQERSVKNLSGGAAHDKGQGRVWISMNSMILAETPWPS